MPLLKAPQQSIRWLLAELVVVVLGVLIAFQVDAWNQGRLEQRRAVQYAERLLGNIQADIEELERVARIARIRLEMIRLVDASLRDETIPASDPGRYIQALDQISWITPFTSNDATFSELINTGDIALLPIELRDAIYAYYGRIGDRESMEPAREVREEAYKRFAGVLTLHQSQLNYQYRSGSGMPEGLISADEAQAAAQRLRNKPEAIAWLPELYASKEATLVSTDALTPMAEDLRERLEAYLVNMSE